MQAKATRSRAGTIRRMCKVAIIALAILVSGRIPVAARAAPTLAVTPLSSPCGSQVVLTGSGFDPGIRVGLVARATAPPGGQGIEFAAQTVAGDGTFRVAVTVETIVPTCRAATPPPDGTVYTIYVRTPPSVDKTGAGPEVTLVTATFTLGVATPGLPNTGGGGAHLPEGQPTAAALMLGVLLVLIAVGASAAMRTPLRSRHLACIRRETGVKGNELSGPRRPRSGSTRTVRRSSARARCSRIDR